MSSQQITYLFINWVLQQQIVALAPEALTDELWQQFLHTPEAIALINPVKEKPKRTYTRKPKEPKEPVPVPEGEEAKPKRKYTRKPKEPVTEGEEVAAPVEEKPKPKRTYTRTRRAGEASTPALGKPKEPVPAPVSEGEAEVAQPVEEKPKRKYTRKPKEPVPVPEGEGEAEGEVAEKPKPKRTYTRKNKVAEPSVVVIAPEPEPENTKEQELDQELVDEPYAEEEWTEYYKDGVLYYTNSENKWTDAGFNPCECPVGEP